MHFLQLSGFPLPAAVMPGSCFSAKAFLVAHSAAVIRLETGPAGRQLLTFVVQMNLLSLPVQKYIFSVSSATHDFQSSVLLHPGVRGHLSPGSHAPQFRAEQACSVAPPSPKSGIFGTHFPV